jgi:hypothetical protein
MESDTLLFDPEFEAILRDVAADPRSSLLRVKRPHKLGELFDAYSPISAHATGLTSAERHLVQVHRNEVAWLLRQACLIKLIEGPTSRQFVSRYTAPGKEVRLLASAEMEQRVREQREQAEGPDECADGLELVSRCVAHQFGEMPSIAELATAAFRFESTGQVRLIVGLDLALRSEPRGSLSLMRHLLMHEPTGRDAVRAWEYVALSLAELGDLVGAHDSLKQAAGLGVSGALNCLPRFVLELQMGMKNEVLESSREMDGLLSANEPVVDWFVQALADRRQRREWIPTSDGARLALTLCDRLGQVGRRVANVLS